MSRSEAETEQEIQAKGLTAPRLTPALIDATIVGEAYHVFAGTTVTVCALKLRNGFVMTGESAAASPENFDPEIGRKVAREKAREKIWSHEGYLLRQRLHEAALLSPRSPSPPACPPTSAPCVTAWSSASRSRSRTP